MLKGKGQKKIHHDKINLKCKQKALLNSDKVDFKTKKE